MHMLTKSIGLAFIVECERPLGVRMLVPEHPSRKALAAPPHVALLNDQRHDIPQGLRRGSSYAQATLLHYYAVYLSYRLRGASVR